MFRTACNSGRIKLWAWPEFPLPGNGSRIVSILAVKFCAAFLEGGEGGRTILCTFLTLLLTVWGHSAFDSPPMHPPRVREMAWLTGSVQGTFIGNGLNCLYNCTAASNLRGLSQPPFPLSLNLRFPLPDSARATPRIGSFRPLSHKRVLPPPFGSKGGSDYTRLWERGRR